MTILNQLKKQLRSNASDIMSDFSKEGMEKDELVSMFGSVAEVLHGLQDTNTVGQLLGELGNDTYAVIGYCSDNENDLFEDIER